MKRSIAILGLVGLLAGCAWHGREAAGRALVLETATDAQLRIDGTAASPLSGVPQEDPRREHRTARPAPGIPQEADSPEEPSSRWQRMDEATELAILRADMERAASWRARRQSRPWGVTAFGQLPFGPERDALATPVFEDPTWNEVLKKGWGVGLELSYQPVPVLQPYAGVKLNSHGGGTTTYRYIGVTIEQETSRWQVMPFYAGLQLNFPLALSLERWFDPAAAGRTTGVIPFLQIGGGGAYSFGSEIEVRDLTNSITTRVDFLRRGFTGYLEGAVGVEYRTAEGFALRLSVGVESYRDLEIDREYRQFASGARAERLNLSVLPRISASVYF
ncbi:MAG: hypothetical protein JXQ29_00295 [Planctomycetes bacterium]|nr:hypothetical protein [Planctomycetota bacterium]